PRMKSGRILAYPGAVALATWTAACSTPHKALRMPEGGGAPFSVTVGDGDLADSAKRKAAERASIEEHPGYALSFVEFDDQGAFWDRRQLEAVEKAIRTKAGGPKDSGVVIILFVHGWRHNADLCDRNVGAFRELLRKIYLDELQIIEATGLRRRPRPVVGVYVGWRGLSKKMWPFEQLSFVSRKNTAIRVGSGDMMELL